MSHLNSEYGNCIPITIEFEEYFVKNILLSLCTIPYNFLLCQDIFYHFCPSSFDNKSVLLTT